MERVMSVEEKIRRAEEIYAKRQAGNRAKLARVEVGESSTKKDIRLLKKMIIQIIVCLLIYFVIYIVQHGNYIFSQDFLNKVNEIISYDTNFQELYEKAKSGIMSLMKNQQGNDNQENNSDINQQGNENQENLETTDSDANIGGEAEQTENVDQQFQNVSQTEADIQTVKNTTSLIKPIEGTISSKYGPRNPTTASVPKNHTRIRYCSKYRN